jgi:hypothetical protein
MTIAPEPVEIPAAAEHEGERGCERDRDGEQAAGHSGGGVADHGHRQHHRSRGDLAEGNRPEELGGGHPVVGAHGVVLHQRDDHETAAVRECAYLESHPGQGQEAADRG